jgi:DNA-binding MarR family transcriptional regulator
MKARRPAAEAIEQAEPAAERETGPAAEAAGYAAELESHVGYMLRRAQLAVFADFTSVQQGPVPRPGQFSVLFVVGRHPGLSQAQLCAALSIKRANLVAVLDQFEALGLARREASAHDRRSNRLYLTAAGEAALAQGIEAQRRHETRIAGALGANGRRELLALLEKLCALGSG